MNRHVEVVLIAEEGKEDLDENKQRHPAAKGTFGQSK